MHFLNPIEPNNNSTKNLSDPTSGALRHIAYSRLPLVDQNQNNFHKQNLSLSLCKESVFLSQCANFSEEKG